MSQLNLFDDSELTQEEWERLHDTPDVDAQLHQQWVNEKARPEPETLRVATEDDLKITELEGMANCIPETEAEMNNELTEEELEKLESDADLKSEISAIRLSRLRDECKGGYHSELMKQPGKSEVY